MLYNFSAEAEGGSPGALILDPAGNLYGTITSGCGMVYKLDPSGNMTTLHTFGGTDDECGPMGSLAIDIDGHIYGATGGGSFNVGTLFELE